MINMPPEYYEYAYYFVVLGTAFGILAMYIAILLDTDKK